jgi:hypothetical protein
MSAINIAMIIVTIVFSRSNQNSNPSPL